MAPGHRRDALAVGLALAALILSPARGAFALDPSLEVSQYAHTSWTVRDGVFKGNIYAIAQTPDGYLWLGTEFGLLRFDGMRSVPWQPPAGQTLPDPNVNSLLVTRDGTLWIGTFAGLVTWKDGKLARRAEAGTQFIASLLEDRMGTVWVGTLEAPHGRLCALRADGAQCYGEDGSFGRAVWALYEDGSGTLWAGAQSGLWRIRPGPPRQYAPPMEVIGLNTGDDGRLLIAMHEAGLRQLVGEKVERRPIPRPGERDRLLQENEIDSNRLLRDRDGGLWIGTVQHGLIHLQHGRTDVFTRADGLSGDVVLSLFDDREGNIWVTTTGGLDRFRELPVTTITTKQGLSSDGAHSVVAARDGSVWIAALDGLTRWKSGAAKVFRSESGLPGAPQSLHEDHRGRVWVSTDRGLAYFRDGRFVPMDAVLGGRVHSMTGDEAGHLWLAEDRSLVHLRDGRLVEQVPWSGLGRRQQANVILAGLEPGGVWLGFWSVGGGGVSYFRDGQLRASYGAPDGLGRGHVPDLRLDEEGALWVATHQGGVSRIDDGRITTLTSRNGLPCDSVHWTMEDDDRSFWSYSACGLVRIARDELRAWIAHPQRRIEATVWDAADGVRLRSLAASEFGPRVAKAEDGRLWFVTGEGIQVVDPRHLAVNNLAPPVLVEQIVADGRIQGPNLPGAAVAGVRLQARTRDLRIEYTALSLVAPEKVRFKYKLEGQDRDWREVVGVRQAQYTNLPPGSYRFRVIACNNSGVWNAEGASLEFTIPPAWHQTIAFRALAAAALAALLFSAYRLRVRIVERRAGEMSAFNERLMKAQEQERTRIAGELHDSVMQQITALSLVLGTAKRKMASDPEAKEMVVEVQRKLIDLGGEVRQLSHDLHPPMLKEAGLPEVLRGYCDEFGDLRGIAVSCDADESLAELSPGTALALYRVAQEALGNAAKHAAPTRVAVRLFRSGGDVVLSVADDGRGFEPGRGEGGGLGLVNMRERARQLGGTFELDSRPGHGTTVRVAVPFRAREVKPADTPEARK